MTGWSEAEIWLVIAALAFGTFVLRFSFLGLFAGRDLPEWLLRHLRYTAVAILPALITPLVLWPAATGGTPDPARLTAAFVALATGYLTRNAIAAIAVGMAALFLMIYLIG